MGGFATSTLAIAVSKAGGLGQIGSDASMKDLDIELGKVEGALDRTSEGLLPIGVGLLVFVTKRDHALEVLQKYKPAVVWLFAAHELSDYAQWAKEIRQVSPQSQVWVQIGSVAGALETAKETKPDVLCVQGIDAGGHGWERGAGIISLLPEVSDAFATTGIDIPLVAAGGIADGRAAAAAFTLGAQGVVLGTRFIAATETKVNAQYRAAILDAEDGGQSTVRDKVFDNLRGKNIWPGKFDGRSLRTASFQDHENGVSIHEIRDRHAEAIKEDDAGYAPGLNQGRAATWAGTGVGLVRAEQSAEAIVEEVRTGVIAALEAVKARL